MSDSEADLVAKKARIFKLVLAPRGRAFGDLEGQLARRCDVALSMSDAISMTDSPANARLVMISGIEEADLQFAAGSSHPLGQLRKRVTHFLNDGISVVLLSRYPRLRYPVVPGSSLLEDARHYYPRLRDSSEGDHFLQPMPGWDPSLDEIDFLTEIVMEIGPLLAARLDQILFESPLSPRDALAELSPSELDALRFAGLVTPRDERYGWSIPQGVAQLKEALANCLAATVVPPRDLGHAFEFLWRIERRIRAAIRKKAQSEWGSNWKVSLVRPEFEDQILVRARGVAYNKVARIAAVRDPLEWLTLPELLKLREDKVKLGHLGLDRTFWPRLASDVVPIRNQVSHMRFLMPGDVEKLRRWDALLAQNLILT